MRKPLILLVTLAIIGLFGTSCSWRKPQVVERVKEVPKVVIETVVVEKEKPVVVTATPAPGMEPVTLNIDFDADIPTLDPQLATDINAINTIEGLFLGLTDFNAETNEVEPELATYWSVSDDGLVWTFHLRDDIPWVYHNPITNETTVAKDSAGKERYVTAQDVVYGIQRACDPATGSPYVFTLFAIKHCETVNNLEEVTQADLDSIGVTAVDDHTLQIELAFPAGYFLPITTMWTARATPRWVMEEHGGDWTEAGNIVTNGPMVLHEWVHSVRTTLLRNPLWPDEFQGNVERVVITYHPDASTRFALWQDNELDLTDVPLSEGAAFREQHPDELDLIPNQRVFYVGFNFQKPPFDDPRVRRAFSAAIDRKALTEDVLRGSGLPMIHLAPPGIFGAPPMDEVGVGTNVEFARQQLADAGYPNCEGFPPVTLLTHSGDLSRQIAETYQALWTENLGCSPEGIQIEQQEFRVLLATTQADTPLEEAPHMWTLGWGTDYPDENNWVGDVLHCTNSANRQRRECGEVDDLILEAGRARDPEKRKVMYRQIEGMFFGEDGLYPLAPTFVQITHVARHTWVARTPALFGGQHYWRWNIDWTAKQAARR